MREEGDDGKERGNKDGSIERGENKKATDRVTPLLTPQTGTRLVRRFLISSANKQDYYSL